MVTIGSKKTELRRSYAKLQEISKRRSRIALEHNTDDLRQDFLKVYFIANVVFNISRNAFVAQLSFLVILLLYYYCTLWPGYRGVHVTVIHIRFSLLL